MKFFPATRLPGSELSKLLQASRNTRASQGCRHRWIYLHWFMGAVNFFLANVGILSQTLFIPFKRFEKAD